MELIAKEYSKLSGEPTGWGWFKLDDGKVLVIVAYDVDVEKARLDEIDEGKSHEFSDFVLKIGTLYGKDIYYASKRLIKQLKKVRKNDSELDNEFCLVVYDKEVYKALKNPNKWYAKHLAKELKRR